MFRDDEWTGEFEDGGVDQVEWAGGRLRLIPGSPQGSFVSRVYDASVPARWQTLSWQPDSPYGKPLPDARAAESGYEVGGIDMAGNILLMHFEEAGPYEDGYVVTDASSRGNNGTIISTGGTSSSVPGVFGSAMDDDYQAYVSIPTGGTQDFDFGTDDFTWALWFQFDHGCPTNNVFMGVDDLIGGGDGTPHLWLGCSSSFSACAAQPHPAGVITAEHGNPDDGFGFCGDLSIGDGNWHSLVLLKQGHATATALVFVDGQLVAEESGPLISPIFMENDSDFGIGGFSGSTYPTELIIDEAAIWTRALSDAEIEDHYRRGSTRLQVQVRVCGAPDCADEPDFVGGADLSPDQWFVDPIGVLSPGTEISLDGLPPGRYVQYRLEFFGPTDGPVPALTSVTLEAEP